MDLRVVSGPLVGETMGMGSGNPIVVGLQSYFKLLLQKKLNYFHVK